MTLWKFFTPSLGVSTCVDDDVLRHPGSQRCSSSSRRTLCRLVP
uniref:Uncharacterized protein n=1 Tax=Heterorhabditis bacteriophora TaxID=37862 RepID=A0A1I7XI67_HETBA